MWNYFSCCRNYVTGKPLNGKCQEWLSSKFLSFLYLYIENASFNTQAVSLWNTEIVDFEYARTNVWKCMQGFKFVILYICLASKLSWQISFYIIVRIISFILIRFSLNGWDYVISRHNDTLILLYLINNKPEGFKTSNLALLLNDLCV